MGAYKSGHAIVLRSKPVAKTKLSITNVPEIIERDAKEIVIDICLEYDGPYMHSGQGKLCSHLCSKYLAI